MPAPSVAELRRVAQPEGVLGRRSGEHWAGRLYMRHVSIYATRVLVALRVAPNTVTFVGLLRRISEPDLGHIHHRLVAWGWSTRSTVLVLYGATLVLSLIALMTARFD